MRKRSLLGRALKFWKPRISVGHGPVRVSEPLYPGGRGYVRLFWWLPRKRRHR
jgi:hypothetical protein